jgi:hypothetical protein
VADPAADAPPEDTDQPDPRSPDPPAHDRGPGTVSTTQEAVPGSTVLKISRVGFYIGLWAGYLYVLVFGDPVVMAVVQASTHPIHFSDHSSGWFANALAGAGVGIMGGLGLSAILLIAFACTAAALPDRLVVDSDALTITRGSRQTLSLEWETVDRVIVVPHDDNTAAGERAGLAVWLREQGEFRPPRSDGWLKEHHAARLNKPGRYGFYMDGPPALNHQQSGELLAALKRFAPGNVTVELGRAATVS